MAAALAAIPALAGAAGAAGTAAAGTAAAGAATAAGAAAATGAAATGISTAEALASGAALVGSGVSALGAVMQGSEQAGASRYNAEVEQQRAQEAQQQSQAQAQQIQQNTARQMGEAAAAFGAGGVDLTGTPLSLMSDLAMQGELSRQLTLYRGTVGAQSDRQQAALDQTQGGSAAFAGAFKAGSTLLTGVGNFATTGPGKALLGVS